MGKNELPLCDENETLLQQTLWWKTHKSIQFLAAHMRTCALCRIGRVHLSVIPQEYSLTCGESRRNFPRFFEATKQEAPLQEYGMLCLLNELEERDEMRE
jgi:hypothetical protein